MQVTKFNHAGHPFLKEPVKSKRARATVILEREAGILLTETGDRKILLPGGTINCSEPPIAAAGRELYEETSLQATSISFLFNFESHSTCHHVFLATAPGEAKAGSDAAHLFYVQEKDIDLIPNFSPATRNILLNFFKNRAASSTS